MTNFERVRPRGLGGWFAVFLVLFLLGTLRQGRVLLQETEPGAWGMFNISFSLGLFAGGLLALVNLVTRHPTGIAVARFVLLGAACVEFWRMFSVDYWTLARIADELVILAIVGGLFWTLFPVLMVLYLRKSKRVQNTFFGGKWTPVVD